MEGGPYCNFLFHLQKPAFLSFMLGHSIFPQMQINSLKCVSDRLCVCACMRTCVRACVRVCMCVCVCMCFYMYVCLSISGTEPPNVHPPQKNSNRVNFTGGRQLTPLTLQSVPCKPGPGVSPCSSLYSTERAPATTELGPPSTKEKRNITLARRSGIKDGRSNVILAR